jgi:hypothetical protein
MIDRTIRIISDVIKIGLEEVKNTVIMDAIRDDREVLQDLVDSKISTPLIDFFLDIHGKDFRCPKCGNSVRMQCPRGICGYCNSTINITTTHSEALCVQCAGNKKKECKHPGSGESIHFKL